MKIYSWCVDVIHSDGATCLIGFEADDLASEKQRMLAIEWAAQQFKEWLEREMPKEYGP